MTGGKILIDVIGTIIGILIGILFVVLLCFCIDKLVIKTVNDKEIVEIYSVDLEANGKGNFVLGCGSCDDEQPYMDITYSWDVKMYLPKDSIIQKYDVNLK